MRFSKGELVKNEILDIYGFVMKIDSINTKNEIWITVVSDFKGIRGFYAPSRCFSKVTSIIPYAARLKLKAVEKYV